VDGRKYVGACIARGKKTTNAFGAGTYELEPNVAKYRTLHSHAQIFIYVFVK